MGLVRVPFFYNLISDKYAAQAKAKGLSQEEAKAYGKEKISSDNFKKLVESEIVAKYTGEALNNEKLLKKYADKDKKFIAKAGAVSSSFLLLDLIDTIVSNKIESSTNFDIFAEIISMSFFASLDAFSFNSLAASGFQEIVMPVSLFIDFPDFIIAFKSISMYAEQALSPKNGEVFTRFYSLKYIEKVAEFDNSVHLDNESLTESPSTTIYKYSRFVRICQDF